MSLYKYAVTVITLLFFNLNLNAQLLHGKVVSNNPEAEPVPFANVFWQNSAIGTQTDAQGNFSIPVDNLPVRLIISSVGYKTDTLNITSANPITIHLKKSQDLKAVTVEGRVQSNSVSLIDPLHVEKISSGELQRAACCNLSESFQTNASVDVGYTDAVSGSKQIQMLGLDGIYSQILSENIPFIKGLSSAYGLNYIPGTWIESILVTKGTGSVVSGYESITGQIQLELIEPNEADKLFINTYVNNNLRSEVNIHLRTKINDSLGGVTFAHVSLDNLKVDMNKDGFLDNPQTKQFNVLNRWHYSVPGKREHQWGIHFINENRNGGQNNFSYQNDHGKTDVYGLGIKTRLAEVFTKNGFMFKDKSYKSIGTMASARYHTQESFFGLKNYNAEQKSLYVNGIYQTIISDTRNVIKVGPSLRADVYKENFNDSIFNSEEYVPGSFVEYTYNDLEKFSLVAGLRGDYNSRFGLFATPRLHIKYNYMPNSAVRLSGGKGYRSPRIFTENATIFASSRNIIIKEPLKQEEAWNYGITLTHQFTFLGRDASFDMDFFRTDFVNQVVVDLEKPREMSFYNLKGKSYSNSFQSGLNFFVMEGLEIKVAYKIYDVQATYNGTLLQKPYISRQRALSTISYQTENEIWKFDFTLRWFGQGRIPSTAGNSQGNTRGDNSPDYFIMNAQVTKAFKRFDVYLGGDNLNNFMQANPVIDAGNPFSSEFDASMIWGPVMGRTIYAGLRFSIKN